MFQRIENGIAQDLPFARDLQRLIRPEAADDGALLQVADDLAFLADQADAFVRRRDGIGQQSLKRGRHPAAKPEAAAGRVLAAMLWQRPVFKDGVDLFERAK